MSQASRRSLREGCQSCLGYQARWYINLIDVLWMQSGLSLSKQACFCAPRGTRTLGLLVRNQKLYPEMDTQQLVTAITGER